MHIHKLNEKTVSHENEYKHPTYFVYLPSLCL